MKDFKKMPKMACGGKVKKMADGGSAFVGTKLNLPVKTRLGKVSSSDAKLLNEQDKSSEGQKAKFDRRNAIPSSAGTAQRYGTTPENEELQYIKRGGRIAKKLGKVKKYENGGNVVAGALKAIRSGKDLDPGIMAEPKIRIIKNLDGNKVEVKPVPMPKINQDEPVNIPGIGKYKQLPSKYTDNGAMLLKKGGKVKRGNKK